MWRNQRPPPIKHTQWGGLLLRRAYPVKLFNYSWHEELPPTILYYGNPIQGALQTQSIPTLPTQPLANSRAPASIGVGGLTSLGSSRSDAQKTHPARTIYREGLGGCIDIQIGQRRDKGWK